MEAGNDAGRRCLPRQRGENDGIRCIYVALSDNSPSPVSGKLATRLYTTTIDPARENLDWYFANAARVERPLGIEAMGEEKFVAANDSSSSSKIWYPFFRADEYHAGM